MKQELQNLEKKIAEGKYLLGIIGLGYVGLPLSLTFLSRDIPVLGFDIDPAKVDKLNAGRSYIKHIPADKLGGFVAQGLFSATSDFSRLNEPDVLLMCVPTPLTQKREPDMQFIIKSSETIAKYLKPGQLICFESTTYPGTTREVVAPILESSGLKAGRDFHLDLPIVAQIYRVLYEGGDPHEAVYQFMV